jgi:DNA-binding transcriptional regulator/RsmH inhibitor MraZ
MLYIPEKKVVSDGFCWGKYESKIDEESRIRLNKRIVDILRKQKVHQLWCFADPSRDGIVLSPPSSRDVYMDLVFKSYTDEQDRLQAYRKYICTGELIGFDNQGRFSLTSASIEHFKIKIGEQIVLLGTGLWFEVWKSDDWYTNIVHTNI